jgi:integrase
MPRPGKGARLWLRPARRKNGRVIANAVWIIRDGGRDFATGCVARSAGKTPSPEAERALAAYIATKYKPPRRQRDIEVIDVADVLAIYLEDKTPDPRPDDKSPEGIALKKLESMIGRLNDYWGGKMLSEVGSETCREFVKRRKRVGGARADLEVLRAAINHHAGEQLHNGIVKVTLPPKGSPRERWLTRDEAAALLWTCWRYRETQTVHRGKAKGSKIETDKRPLRHLARFILIGLYTGTRASAIAAASPYQQAGRAYVDLEAGTFYRLAIGRRATKKRQPTAPIPLRLLAHMRRWVDRGIAIEHFVEWHGEPVKSVKTAFNSATRLAGLGPNALGRVTPHVLRHSCATWLMQAGVDMWEAAGFLGMSVAVLEKTYGHHHPNHLQNAARGIGYGTRKRVSVVVSVVEPTAGESKPRKVV